MSTCNLDVLPTQCPNCHCFVKSYKASADPALILCGLPLRGWVAVVPNHFHFVIIPLTVDCGIFSREEISRLDSLHRWHPITVPRWNSLSSWERPILSQMFVEADCMPRCLNLYTCGVIGTPEFNYLDGWVNTFGNIMYLSLSPAYGQPCTFICCHA